ncbi:MAG: hypothetical protein LC687_08315, partial [Actinobacteria bacterium]|nr:hypothetical protein [Actinomycetota bacterium]
MDSDNESSDDKATPPPLSQRPIRDSDSDSSDSEDSNGKARIRPRRKIKVSTRSSTRKRGEVQPRTIPPKTQAVEARPKDKSSGRKGKKKVSKKKGSGSRTGKKKRKSRYDDGQGTELQDEPDPHPEKNDDDNVTGYNNPARTAQAKLDDKLFTQEERDAMEQPNKEEGETIPEATARILHPSKKDVDQYSRFFPGTDIDTLRKTFDSTTQYGSKGATSGHTLYNQIASPNPILNIPRRHENVATNTLYSDTPAFDSGSTAAQFFIGRKSHYRTARSLGSSDRDFAKTLMDEIRKYGAMDKLVSDNAKA